MFLDIHPHKSESGIVEMLTFEKNTLDIFKFHRGASVFHSEGGFIGHLWMFIPIGAHQYH